MLLPTSQILATKVQGCKSTIKVLENIQRRCTSVFINEFEKLFSRWAEGALRKRIKKKN